MSRHIELGPFIEVLKGTSSIDIDNIDSIDIPAANSNDREIIQLLRFSDDDTMFPSEDRSLFDGKVNVEWNMEMKTTSNGIWGVSPRIIRIWGELEIEDLPPGADPNDLDIELERYEYEFDTEGKNWNFEYDDYSLNKIKITDGIWISSVLLDFKNKKAEISFG